MSAVIHTLASLRDFSKDLTPEEQSFVEQEKKYYEVVVELRKKREHLGMTQQELSRLSRVPRTTITKIESGSRNATLQTLMSMAEAMGSALELRLR